MSEDIGIWPVLLQQLLINIISSITYVLYE